MGGCDISCGNATNKQRNCNLTLAFLVENWYGINPNAYRNRDIRCQSILHIALRAQGPSAF
jgi:hypothetical protein